MKRQKGQALIEYLMLVAISIMIIGGFVYKFNSAFQNYMTAYFGEDGYLGCLIRNGLLPGQEADDCTIPRFDIATGTVKIVAGSGGGSGGGSGRSGSNGSNSGKSGGGKRGSGGGEDDLKGKRGAPDKGRGGTVEFSGRDRKGFGGGSGRGGDGVRGGAGDEASYTGSNKTSSNSQDNGLGPGGSGEGGSGRMGYVPAPSNMAGGSRKPPVIPAVDRDLKTAREIAAEKAKKKIAENIEAQFTFTNILRYLIIIALIFSILFFVGSQVFALSKGSRKR